MSLSSYAGNKNAWQFAYGVNPEIEPLRIDQGNTTTGAASITVTMGYITLADGANIQTPVLVGVPIIVGTGANAETVTPTAVSFGTPQIYSTCTITATFANLHGQGDLVTTGTVGLGEAVAVAHGKGGLVSVDGFWAFNGGQTSTITSTKGFTNVTVLDWRGTTGAVSYTSSSNGANMAATARVLY